MNGQKRRVGTTSLARTIAAFIRHGKYEQPVGVPSAHLPHGLTNEGLAEVTERSEALMEFCERRGWAIHPEIDCSRMLRAYQTATTLADRISGRGSYPARVLQYNALAERGLGAAANLTVEQIEAIVAGDPRYSMLPPGWKSSSDFRLPFQGAESLMRAGRRVAAHVRRRLARLGTRLDTDLVKLFVGHGAAFRHAAVHLGVLTKAEAVACSMYHCRPVFLEQLGDGSWRHIAGEWRPRARRGID